MAERTVVRRAQCFSVPDDVDDNAAAAIPNPGVSAWLSLKNEWGRNKDMEPQRRGSDPPLHTRERYRTLSLRKTTLGSRVHVQPVGLNAETKKVSAPAQRGDFSLDISLYRSFPITAFGLSRRPLLRSK